MAKRFWEFFAYRTLTLYCQLQNHSQHHGFLLTLTLLGEELKIKSQPHDRDYIQSFEKCTVDPELPIDIFSRHMKVCRSIYAKEFPAFFHIESYLCKLLRESSNYHLEKKSYKPRNWYKPWHV